MMPARTFAIVVGIESYAAGSEWNLNGPAADAILFVQWLRGRGVPAKNILLFLSPLAENKNRVEQSCRVTGVWAQPACLTPIHNALAQTLPTLEGDVLFLFWGGHGVVTRAEDRRLFYADATTGDKKNLDFQSLIEMLRSASMSKLRRHIAYVDACANFFSEMRSVVDLEGDKIPAGADAIGFVQEVLFAAASGEVAINEGGRGLFSKFLLEWLEKDKSGIWPPEQAKVRDAVRGYFSELRAKGQGAQSPVHFVWMDAAGMLSEGSIPPPREVLIAARTSGLSTDQLRGVSDVLLDCPSMRERKKRDTLYLQLPATMQQQIVRHDDAAADLLNFVSAAFRYQNRAGMAILMDALRQIENDRHSLDFVEEKWERVVVATGARRSLKNVPFTTAEMQKWYLASTPDYQKAPVAKTLDDVLESLKQMATRRAGVSPLIEFMVRVSRQYPAAELVEWIQSGADVNALADLKRALDDEDAEAACSKTFLLVEVATADDARKAVPPHPTRVEALLLTGGKWGWHESVQCKPNRESLREVFGRILSKAQLIGGPDMVIEFLLPRKLLCLAPQDWEFGGDYEAPVAVGLTHPVVLRWRERIRDAVNAKQSFWISRASRIRKRLKASAPKLLWVAPDEYDVVSLRKHLARDDAEDFVVLLFLPPEIPSDMKQDLLIAALVSGAPYALWLDADPKQLDGLQKEINNLTHAGELELLPWRVRHLRQAAQADPSHFARSLNVVWDIPEHTPPHWRIAAPEYKENL